MNEGYILLYRSFFENEFLFGDGHKFTKPEIWLWMLVYARWQDSPRSFTIRGNKVTVNRGELAKSGEELKDTWGLSRPTINKLLKEFEIEGMIQVKKSNVINKIRIVNYEKYQFNSLQQILQQNLQQKKDCLQQEQPVNTDNVEENANKPLQQNLQQILQQNLQQILQPINNNIITSSSSICGQQNFSSLIDVVEFVKIKKQPEALLQLSEMMMLQQTELIRLLDEFAIANIDADKRTLLVWGKYFQASKDSILSRIRNNEQKTKQQPYESNKNNSRRGTIISTVECDYTKKI